MSISFVSFAFLLFWLIITCTSASFLKLREASAANRIRLKDLSQHLLFTVAWWVCRLGCFLIIWNLEEYLSMKWPWRLSKHDISLEDLEDIYAWHRCKYLPTRTWQHCFSAMGSTMGGGRDGGDVSPPIFHILSIVWYLWALHRKCQLHKPSAPPPPALSHLQIARKRLHSVMSFLCWYLQ